MDGMDFLTFDQIAGEGGLEIAQEVLAKVVDWDPDRSGRADDEARAR